MTAWKWGELNGLLLPFICSQIATMFLWNDEGKRDEICWGENKSGSFTVKSAYMLVAHSPTTANGIWNWMGKLTVPQKLRLFTWLLLHGKILTNLERIKRGFTGDPYCYCCINEREDLNHLFRFCTRAKYFWKLFVEEYFLKTAHIIPFSD